MAVPSYKTDLTDIDLAEANTNWDESSNAAWDDGGAATQEQDFYIQGNYCVSEALKTGTGSLIYDNTTGITWTDSDVFMAWNYCTGPSAMAAYSAGGMRYIIGSSYGDFYAWDVYGADYYTYGGWICIPLDPTLTADYTVGSPAAWSSMTKDHWGSAFNITGNISKGNTHGIDAIRYGRAKSIMYGGDASEGYCTFDGYAASNDSSTARWGLIQEVSGGYLFQGQMTMGTTASAVDFRDSNKLLFIAEQLKVYREFNRILVSNSSSRVDWTNITLKAAGTVSRGTFVASVDADINFDGCSFLGMDTFTFKGSSEITDSTFSECATVDSGGGTFNGTNVLQSRVDTDGAALIWNVATAPDNYLNDMTFSKGTNDHHAIEFGLNAPTTIGIDNMTSDSFADTDSENHSTFYVASTLGTYTINVTNSTGNFTYKSAGATVDVIISPVTLTVEIDDLSTGNPIENARVLVWPSDDSNFPYDDTVTISGSGTTASVNHPSHGLATSDNVIISGVNEDVYNGAYSITYVDANYYTYTTTESMTSTPATGTIKSTFAMLNGLTNANGSILDTRTYGVDQPITGWARKSSGSPYYQQAVISGTVDKDTGLTLISQLVSDE